MGALPLLAGQIIPFGGIVLAHGPSRVAPIREPPDKVVSNAVTRLEVPWLDLTPIMHADDDPLAFFPGRKANHFNAAGCAVMGDAVAAFVSELGRCEGRAAR